MDFSYSPKVIDLQQRLTAFMDEHIYPAESVYHAEVDANRAAGSPLSVSTGHEVVCDGMLLLGADGCVPGLANVDPAGYVRMFNAAERGDWATANRLKADVDKAMTHWSGQQRQLNKDMLQRLKTAFAKANNQG